MNRAEIKELYYITHIDNLTSIMEKGILSHYKAERFQRMSIADQEIQKRREKVVIPGGKCKLHDYANLYFNARNAMMFKLRDIHKDLAVVRINSTILDEPDVIVSDGNASSDYVRFYPSAQGIENLDKSLVFALVWTSSDEIEYWKRKSAVCAEVLVPDCIKPGFIIGIYVSCQETKKKVTELLTGSSISSNIKIDHGLFFLGI